MPSIRVDFYLLTDNGPQAPLLLACRLLEKAYLNNQRCFVYCATKKEAENLDELLWIFKDNSFIPHHLQEEAHDSPIHIGYTGSEPSKDTSLLVNLAAEIPLFYPRFSRIIEIVANNEAAKTLSRTHYREYRTKQCELFTHNIVSASLA